ncbi:toprim domain-containing protein [Thermorudis peleae]|uniref:toprim domain-containing protein n=1 Tax=Thermorudis peleae TaxID=1382356 RepID=UPI0006920677|nr:toprim domain-containing protein [Thermorudis peleae]
MTERVDVRRILNALTCDKAHCRCQRSARDGQGLVHCPCHSDDRPSLNVTVGNDGTILLRCHAGCPNHAVIRALQDRDLWPRRERRERPPVRETRYELRDLDGTLVAIHIRRDKPGGSKELFWQLPDGRWELNGKRVEELPLYGVEKLGDAPEVIIVEGEKAAGALLQLGLSAVGTVCGASVTPSDDVLRPLASRRVFLWPDNDAAGMRHMQRIAERLTALGCGDVRWVDWPDAPEKGDAADFVARGGTAEDVRRLLERARPWTPDEAPASANAEHGSAAHHVSTERDERRSQATRVLELVESRGLELWHTPDDEPWATIPVGEEREHWPLASRAFRTWLQRAFYERYGELAHHQAVADAIDALSGRALFDGAEHPVFVRIAEHAGALYLDLADEQWRAVEITADGWRVVTNPPVRFRRPRGLQPLPVPERGGSLARLWRFIRVAPEDRPLVAGWLVMTFRPRGPYPVLALGGEQGAGKSTTARVLRRLVDPNDADLRAEPREERDLWVAAVNSWLLALDNVSRLSNWLSDALCRIATGAGFAARTLYENREETILAAQRPVLLTAIADVIAQPDLLDRALVLTLPRLGDEEREPESAFWTAFEAERSALLGAVLDGVVQALQREPQVHLTAYPRMADFARWAVAALGEELGAQFLARYCENRRETGTTVLDASPLAAAILAMLETGGDWRGTAQELLDDLEAQADEETRRKRERMRSWPKTARGLAGEVRRLAPALRQHGVAVEFVREGHDRRRLIVLARAKAGAQPSASSASSAHAANPHPDADLAADGVRTVADDCEQSVFGNRPQRFGRADGEFPELRTVADGADGHFAGFRADGAPGEAALAEQVRERLRWLAPVYASRLAEAVGVPFAQLQPVLQDLVERGQLAVAHGEARVMQHSVLVLPEQAGRLVRQPPRTLWRQREER